MRGQKEPRQALFRTASPNVSKCKRAACKDCNENGGDSRRLLLKAADAEIKVPEAVLCLCLSLLDYLRPNNLILQEDKIHDIYIYIYIIYMCKKYI